jgi:very-short-patch-repair endonuclease
MSYKDYHKMTEHEQKNILKQLYVQEKQSLAVIANVLNTYPNKIRRDAIKYGIALRDKSVAQKTALNSGRHKHPTKGTEREETTKQKIGQSVMMSWDALSVSEKNKRQETARHNWNNLSQDIKDNILTSANQAVRQASKTGSKLEKYLLSKLMNDGFKVEFHKEQILSNTKLQIDLFLPTMDIAIEVDGPSHFKEVWGKDALKKNIKYDNKKTGLILGKGLVLIRIKQTMDFSKARATTIYSKLKEQLDSIQQKFPEAGQREIKIGDDLI